MFITYLLRELRRRMRQAIFVGAGLALGIGLVITVIAASTGFSGSQGAVLHSLYGVGTDVSVTQAPVAGSGRPSDFRVGGTQGKAGTTFSRDILLGAGLGTLKSSDVTTISGLKDVSATSGALSLTDLSLSGTVQSGSQQGFGGGGPGSGSVSSSSFTVTGINPADDPLGPLSSATLTSGHGITTAEANSDVAVVESNYAAAQNLKVGSTFKVAGKTFTVVGIARASQSATLSDVYIPLARAQTLASMPGEVNTIYVSAASSADIATVSREISAALPKATVTTSSDLASEVTGSLTSASSLANSLGKWLAVAVLAAAFGIASILTISAVSRRVREFGTLKAMGWRSRRIIRQIMGEALVVGIAGGIAGIALGSGGAALVQSLAPPLTASTVPATASGAAGPGATGGSLGGGGGLARAASSASHTVSVHLTAPVTIGAVALAVALAILGGLIAGSFGGWRAVRLRPAAALARVEYSAKKGHRSHVQAHRSHQGLPEGPDHGARAAGRGPGDRGRRLARHPGTDRPRQEHAAADSRRAGPAQRRHRRVPRPGPGRATRKPADPGARGLDRVHLPDLQPHPHPVRPGERRGSAGPARRHERGAAGARRPRPGRGQPGRPGPAPAIGTVRRAAAASGDRPRPGQETSSAAGRRANGQP